MQDITNLSIALLICGCILLGVTIFMVIVGFQSSHRKRLTNCLVGTIYTLVLISIAICKEENHWMEASAGSVQVRVWASDMEDVKADVGVHLGLKGINITLMTSAESGGKYAFNEKFLWSWGTKPSMVDGCNPYRRALSDAISRGLPLPIQDLAEVFETYGILGAATPGIGLHEAGFYTDLCLTIALGAWITAGLLPPLSLFASFYSALVTCISLTAGTVIYVVVGLSYEIVKRSATHYQLYESDSKTTLMLAYTWCFYVNLVMVFVTAAMTYVINLQATKHTEKQLRKLQYEIEEASQKNEPQKKEAGLGKRTQFAAKRRLTAVFSKRNSQAKGITKFNECPVSGVVSNISAVPISHVIETGVITCTSPAASTGVVETVNMDNMVARQPSIHTADILECDIGLFRSAEEVRRQHARQSRMLKPDLDMPDIAENA